MNPRPPFLGPADRWLVLALVVVSLAWWLGPIWQNGSRKGSYRARQAADPAGIPIPPGVTGSGSQAISGPLGTTLVEWDGQGRVRIASSPCPNQVCVRMGWVAAPEGVCCVPNGVILEFLRGDTPSPGSEIDGIAQ